uniref:Uncharacterized protein n=1 Tax=Octopus bimaculoides TaxID=37653 RepID=A0A0L8I228_OCTBM
MVMAGIPLITGLHNQASTTTKSCNSYLLRCFLELRIKSDGIRLAMLCNQLSSFLAIFQKSTPGNRQNILVSRLFYEYQRQ